MDSNIIQGSGTATGTDTYAVTLSVAVTELVTNAKYLIDFTNSSTGASTLNINSIGATTVQAQDGSAIGSGGLSGVVDLCYDGTVFKKMNENLVQTLIIGGVTLSSSSNTNVLNGTYVILADTTTVTSVTSGIGQDSNWTLEITQAGITNQKGVVTFTGNLEKDAGGGVNYDIAIFKNGSIVSESEQIDQKLESGGKGQSVTVMAITEFSTNDTFDIRVAGNGTADDIFCGGGSLYIQ
jgi:hypothetical protein